MNSVSSIRALLGLLLFGFTPSFAGDGSLSAPGVVEQTPEGKLRTPYYLTGDWGGLRPALERRGITLDLFETFDFYGNISGGEHRALEYFARTRLTLDVDLEKLLGWKGAEFYATAVTQQGEDFGKTKIGVYTNPSGIEGKQTTRLAEIWLQQKLFGDKVAIKVGKIDGVGEFGGQELASTFMNDELNYVTNQTFTVAMPFDPAGKPGAVLTLKPFDGPLLSGGYAKAGLFAGNDNDPYAFDDTGTSFVMRDPAILAAEIGWRAPATSALRPGVYKVGVHYNLGDTVRFDGTTADGNYFIYGQVAQTLGYLDDERTRHIDAGFTTGGAPADRNGNHIEVTAVIRAIGPWAARPKDELGLGFIVSNFSEDLRRPSPAGLPVAGGSEKTLELSYKAQVNRWFILQPNLQVVFDPFGDRDRDPVLLIGMRTIVIF